MTLFTRRQRHGSALVLPALLLFVFACWAGAGRDGDEEETVLGNAVVRKTGGARRSLARSPAHSLLQNEPVQASPPPPANDFDSGSSDASSADPNKDSAMPVPPQPSRTPEVAPPGDADANESPVNVGDAKNNADVFTGTSADSAGEDLPGMAPKPVAQPDDLTKTPAQSPHGDEVPSGPGPGPTGTSSDSAGEDLPTSAGVSPEPAPAQPPLPSPAAADDGTPASSLPPEPMDTKLSPEPMDAKEAPDGDQLPSRAAEDDESRASSKPDVQETSAGENGGSDAIGMPVQPPPDVPAKPSVDAGGERMGDDLKEAVASAGDSLGTEIPDDAPGIPASTDKDGKQVLANIGKGQQASARAALTSMKRSHEQLIGKAEKIEQKLFSKDEEIFALQTQLLAARKEVSGLVETIRYAIDAETQLKQQILSLITAEKGHNKFVAIQVKRAAAYAKAATKQSEGDVSENQEPQKQGSIKDSSAKELDAKSPANKLKDALDEIEEQEDAEESPSDVLAEEKNELNDARSAIKKGD